MATRLTRGRKKTPPPPAFEFEITQADQADGGTPQAIMTRAIQRTLAEMGVMDAVVTCSADRISIVASGVILL